MKKTLAELKVGEMFVMAPHEWLTNPSGIFFGHEVQGYPHAVVVRTSDDSKPTPRAWLKILVGVSVYSVCMTSSTPREVL